MAARIREVLPRLLFSVGLTAALLEVIVRIILGSPPSYQDTLEQTLRTHARLFRPFTRVAYVVRGLYENAGWTELRISARRLIEPDPGDGVRPQVLFLGGSTIEALYVAESARWVALLNGLGLATYNAGQSAPIPLMRLLH